MHWFLVVKLLYNSEGQYLRLYVRLADVRLEQPCFLSSFFVKIPHNVHLVLCLILTAYFHGFRDFFLLIVNLNSFFFLLSLNFFFIHF